MKSIFTIIIFIQFCNLSFTQRADKDLIGKIEKINKLKLSKQIEFLQALNNQKYISLNPAANNIKVLYDSGFEQLKESLTKEDTLAAVKCIKLSALGKYPPALSKLGLLYKYGIGVPCQIDSAYFYFNLAAESELIAANYYRGFMCYKGLGCHQDYEKAFLDFQKCANAGLTSCMYMLALSYRNGFGTGQDSIKAKYWLTLAGENGFEPAVQELNMKLPEINEEYKAIINCYNDAAFLNSYESLKSNEFNKIDDLKNIVFNKDTINGFLVKYDYSGEYIVAIDKIKFSSKIDENNAVECNISTNHDTESTKIKGIFNEKINSISVSRGILNRNDRYIQHTIDGIELIDLSFRKLDVEGYKSPIVSVDILGNSRYEMEKERPLKLFLITESNNNLDSISNSSFQLSTFPNPFESLCNIKIDLENSGNYKFVIYNNNGNIIFMTSEYFLEKGIYIFPMELQLSAGIYFIEVENGSFSKQLKIIKI